MTQENTLSFPQRWLAGALAGCTEAVAVMPFEVVKTRQQLGHSSNESVRMAMQRTVAQGGFSSLYYGLPIVMIQSAGKVGIRFGCFNTFRSWLEPLQLPESSLGFISGFGAGAVEAAVWITPCERLKTLRQSQVGVQKQQYIGWYSTLAKVYQQVGVTGLFRGVTATIIRNAGSVGLRFAIYNDIFSRTESVFQQRWLRALVCGATVGLISTVANNPIDVVKSKMQADAHMPGAKSRYHNSWHCFRSILTESGTRGLFTGLSARLWKITLGQAIIFSSYDFFSSHVSHAFQVL